MSLGILKAFYFEKYILVLSHKGGHIMLLLYKQQWKWRKAVPQIMKEYICFIIMYNLVCIMLTPSVILQS